MRALLLLLLALPLTAQKVHDRCNACHNEQVTDFLQHPHEAKQLSCDTCHGPSEKHMAASGGAAPDRVAAPDEQVALCGACHVPVRKEFEQSKHAKLLLARSATRAPACGTCHGVHAPAAARQIEQRCIRCHNTLPPACRMEVANVAPVRCMSCHSRHTLTAKK